jgi:flagellar assembly protein FliH
VFKSHLCVAANPCQVEIPDPDVFFISDRELKPKEQPEAETEAISKDINEDTSEDITEDLPEEDPLEAAGQEAVLLVSNAQAEAAQILATATREAEQIKTEAEQAGAAAGRQSGLEQIRQELSGKLAQALALLSTAEIEHQRRVLASEPEILKLAVAIAAKIINAELTLDPKQRLAIVKQALGRYDQATTYKIRINPSDLQGLAPDILPELQSVFSEPKLIEIVADAAIAPGGSFIETDHGKIDARLKTQLELIVDELLKVGTLV